jgi:C-terminal processing protease CtpA/Prc
MIKNGPGHEDFSKPTKVYIGPDSKNPYKKTVCILTNRSCYSATSFFVLAMKAFDNVVTIGDTTGGGLGAPTGAELPNGWSFRFSGTRTLSPDGINFEDGIPPDITRNLRTSDATRGVDTIIETAVNEINSRDW